MSKILATPLTKTAFQPFGDVISKEHADHVLINSGRCKRYHDLARVDVIDDQGHSSIAIAESEAYTLPLQLGLVERHPLASQAFIPLGPCRFLVVVCPDQDGMPGTPTAFVASGGQGVNYRANVWHAVLTPLDATTPFLIVDRAGPGSNLVEHVFQKPFVIDIEQTG